MAKISFTNSSSVREKSEPMEGLIKSMKEHREQFNRKREMEQMKREIIEEVRSRIDIRLKDDIYEQLSCALKKLGQ